MEINTVEQIFESVGLRVGGVFLLLPEDARDFVRECERRELPIAGIEGFRVFAETTTKIQPLQEISTDLWDFYGNTWERTLDDLSGPCGSNIWFEVVIESSASRVMNDELRVCVDELYEVFASYRGAPMDNYGTFDVSEQEYVRLVVPKLENVGYEAIDHYVFNAIYTWGDVNGFKRFLPRIYEVLAFERHKPLWIVGMWLPITLLGDADWRAWPRQERELVARYLRLLWLQILDGEPAQHGCELATDAKEVFEGLAVIYSDVTPFLKAWREKAKEGLGAAERLAQFLRYNRDFFRKRESLGVEDWSAGAEGQVQEWLRDASLIEALAAWLEDCEDETICWRLREAKELLELYQERQ